MKLIGFAKLPKDKRVEIATRGAFAVLNRHKFTPGPTGTAASAVRKAIEAGKVTGRWSESDNTTAVRDGRLGGLASAKSKRGEA